MRRWIPAWAVLLVLALAVGTVWLRLSIVRTTYSITQTERSIRNAKQQREQMELKVAGLRSPRRLEALARAKLGLKQPAPEQIVHLTGLAGAPVLK